MEKYMASKNEDKREKDRFGWLYGGELRWFSFQASNHLCPKKKKNHPINKLSDHE